MATNVTETLIQGGIVKRLEMPKYFYQGMFGNRHLSQSDVILFDDVYEDLRGVARFVAPNVVSKVNQTKPQEVKSFRPAYIKEKDVIEAWNPILQTRTAGEAIGGSLTPATRAQMIRAKQLRMHRIMINNRWEQMCHEAMVSGQVVIEGEDYPKTTVSFGRDPSLTVTNLTAKKWNAAGINPLDTLAEMADKVNDVSDCEVDTIIMGRSAWAAFYAYMNHKDRLHLLDDSIRGSNLDLNLMSAGDVRGVGRVMRFTGLNGQTIEVYVDNRYYVTPDGKKKRYVSDKEVIGIDSMSLQGVLAFGAIKDREAGYMPAEIFHKEFALEEPSADYLLSQSAPLPILLNPNCVWRVLDVLS